MSKIIESTGSDNIIAAMQRGPGKEMMGPTPFETRCVNCDRQRVSSYTVYRVQRIIKSTAKFTEGSLEIELKITIGTDVKCNNCNAVLLAEDNYPATQTVYLTPHNDYFKGMYKFN